MGEQVHDARCSVVLFNDTTNTKQHEHDWGVEYGKLVKRSYASRIGSAEDGERFEQLQGVELLGLRKNTMFINSWRSVDSFKWLTIMKVIVGVRLFNVAEIVQCLLPSKVMWKGGLVSSLELHLMVWHLVPRLC